MVLKIEMKYTATAYHRYTDKELVARIIEQNDVGALHYLLYCKYCKDLRYLAYRYCHTLDYYDDMVASLRCNLLGKNADWKPLRNFQGRSSLKTYICRIASHAFDEFRRKNIDTDDFVPQDTRVGTDANGNNVYVIGGKKTDEPSTGSPNERKVILLEAIRRMDNEEHQLILLKMLEGYKPQQIADMLNRMRKHKGITRTYENKEVVITADYVYMMKPKVIAAVKPIVKQVEKEWYGSK